MADLEAEATDTILIHFSDDLKLFAASFNHASVFTNLLGRPRRSVGWLAERGSQSQ